MPRRFACDQLDPRGGGSTRSVIEGRDQGDTRRGGPCGSIQQGHRVSAPRHREDHPTGAAQGVAHRDRRVVPGLRSPARLVWCQSHAVNIVNDSRFGD